MSGSQQELHGTRAGDITKTYWGRDVGSIVNLDDGTARTRSFLKQINDALDLCAFVLSEKPRSVASMDRPVVLCIIGVPREIKNYRFRCVGTAQVPTEFSDSACRPAPLLRSAQSCARVAEFQTGTDDFEKRAPASLMPFATSKNVVYGATHQIIESIAFSAVGHVSSNPCVDT
jgi:hypothetical protein